MTPEKLKRLMSLLLIATGVLHLVVAAVGAPDDLKIPLAVFGAIYAGLGLWLRKGGKPAVLASMAAVSAGLLLGGANYLQNGGPAALLVMFLIDLAVLGAGVLWMMKSGKAA